MRKIIFILIFTVTLLAPSCFLKIGPGIVTKKLLQKGFQVKAFEPNIEFLPYMQVFDTST